MIFESISTVAREGGGFRLSVSSERPCRDTVFDGARGAYRAVDVVLAHTPEAIEGDWIADGIPLRAEHFGTVVGRALNPRIEDGKLVSREIVWSDGPEALQIRSDVEKGVLRDLSIEADYRREDCREEEREGDVPLVRVLRWRPLAAAFVGVPADPSVGVNRDYKSIDKPIVRDGGKAGGDNIRGDKTMETETTTTRNDSGEIFALARKYDVPDEKARRWLEEGADINAVRAEILESFARTNAPGAATEDPLEEMRKAERREYDVIKAINALLPNSKVDAGFEWEVSQECARRYGRQPKGIMVPLSATRAFTTAEGSGAAITPAIHSSTYYDILRSKLVVEKLGAHIMNLSGEAVNIPKAASDGPAVYWINGNGEAVGEGAITTGQVTLQRKTAGTYVDISRALLNGSVPDAQTIVLNAIGENMARGIQLAVLKGDGQNNKPLGLIPKLTPKTFSVDGAPTWQEILANFEGALTAGNIEIADTRWLVSPVTFAMLRGVSRDTGSGKFIATREGGNAYVADLPAEISSVLSAGEMILADWDKMLVGLHSGLDLTVSTEALATSGGIRCIALQDVSTNIVDPSYFSYTATGTGYAE